MNNKKFENAAKTIDTMLKIFQILICMLGALGVIAIPIMLIGGLDVIDSELDFGMLGLVVTDVNSVIDGTVLTQSLVIGLAGAVIVIGIGAYGIHTFRKVLLPMKEGRPFEMGVSNNIRKISILILIGGAVGQITTAITGYLEYRAINMDALFADSAIVGGKFILDISFDFIFMAAIVFLLSYIFSYGEMLQQESDETL